MKTVLAIVRASTEKQDTISQHNDMVQFAATKGFKEEEIEWIEVKGASARKLNKKYLQMIEDIKNTILSTPSIKTVISFHLNRLGRVSSKLLEMMEWFTENKIQVYIENPSITLLNSDFTRNGGAEISWSIFATMVKFDTDEMFEKYSRGKKHNASIGKFNGGQKVKYGYTLDENNYYIIDKESSSQIKMLFEMYASKKYSIRTLCEELNSRGITRTDGVAYRVTFLQALLKDACYMGEPNKRFFNRVYPKIISKDLFDKVQNVLKENNTNIIKQNKYYHLGSMIWKCIECGYYLTSCGGYYKCNHHYNKYAYNSLDKRCSMSNTFCEKHIDKLLWEVAFYKHIEFFLKDEETSKNDIKEQIEVIKEKMKVLQDKIENIDIRKKALSDLFLDGTYTKEEFNIRKKRLENSNIENKELLIKYDEDIVRLNNIINTPKENYKLWFKNVISTINKNTKEKQDLVRKYIDYGNLINNKDNSVTVKIYCFDGTVEEFIYRNKYKNQKLFYPDMKPYYTITDNLNENGVIKIRNVADKMIQDALIHNFI